MEAGASLVQIMRPGKRSIITTTFKGLYSRLVEASVQNHLDKELEQATQDGFDPHHLDYLLNPSKCMSVIRTSDCGCTSKLDTSCAGKCLSDVLYCDENGNTSINKDLCVDCSECINNCHTKKLMKSCDILPTLTAIQHAGAPVYTIVAPTFINQSSSDITSGKLRNASEKIGFGSMVEVVLLADALTLEEALKFDENIQKGEDYQLTSCCYPMWISVIRKMYKQLIPHVPGAVSLMVARGCPIRIMYPGAIIIFIGPCPAKRVEAREPDVSDSADFVLAFQEIKDVLDFVGIDLASVPEDERDHSPRTGRIHAGIGDVNEAVQSTMTRLNPNCEVSIRTAHTDSVQACKEMLSSALEGKLTTNFIEGMGCVGGCVGRPKALIPKGKGRKNVFEYGNTATYPTPIDNPYVIELSHHLGFNTAEDLLERNDVFTHQF